VQAAASLDGVFVGLFNLATVPMEITVTPSLNTPQGTLQTLVPAGQRCRQAIRIIKISTVIK